jgi:hypothetical protein
VSPRLNKRLHYLCISGVEKLTLAGDAYTNCPKGWMLGQEEPGLLTLNLLVRPHLMTDASSVVPPLTF